MEFFSDDDVVVDGGVDSSIGEVRTRAAGESERVRGTPRGKTDGPRDGEWSIEDDDGADPISKDIVEDVERVRCRIAGGSTGTGRLASPLR